MKGLFMEQNSCRLELGYSYVPIQELKNVFSNEEALEKGTLFPELYMPLGVYGKKAFSGGEK